MCITMKLYGTALCDYLIIKFGCICSICITKPAKESPGNLEDLKVEPKQKQNKEQLNQMKADINGLKKEKQLSDNRVTCLNNCPYFGVSIITCSLVVGVCALVLCCCPGAMFHMICIKISSHFILFMVY